MRRGNHSSGGSSLRRSATSWIDLSDLSGLALPMAMAMMLSSLPPSLDRKFRIVLLFALLILPRQ